MGRFPVLLAALLILAIAGCDSGVGPLLDTGGGLGDPGAPLNDTPAHTITRLEVTYKVQALDLYLELLSADFRYEFSAQSDSDLVSRFGTSWGLSEDSTSSVHLFDGFVNEHGDSVPEALIELDLSVVHFVPDTDHPDSAAWYKRVRVPTASLRLRVPGSQPDTITGLHRFHLVRGDAAVLRPGQWADSSRWYVHRHVDLGPTSPTTWGRVKASYFH